MDNQNNRNKQNLPGNNNPNNKNNRQRWNVILFTVMLISFIVFALYQFREDTDAREITYDQFLNMVDSGEVKKVVIEDDKIVITAKTEAEMKNSKKKGASESDVVEGSVADNNDSCAIIKTVCKYVSSWKSSSLCILIICYADNLLISDRCRWVITKSLHDSRHFIHTCKTWEFKTVYNI